MLVRTASGWLAAGMLVLLPVVGAPAWADETGGPAEEPAAADSRLLLVLDASGSMNEPIGGGERRIDAARTALRAMVESLPADQQVGLRVYGATVPEREDPGACTDSQRVVDIASDNRAELLDAVDAYAPLGETPIGHALREAGKDLGPDGERTIVLVSDGEPTCAPDPCKVARRLAADGVDLRIDVVGLDVAGKAREKLRCIADAGNGSYVDAGDAADLTDSLIQSQTRASRPFDLTGAPVEGTPAAAAAPEVATGQYLDRIPSSGSLFYRVPRTTPGSTVHVGIGYRGRAGTSSTAIGLNLGVEGRAVSCSRAVAFGGGVGAQDPIVYLGDSSWAPDPASPCNTADEVVVEIAPQPSAAVLAGQPIELAVYEEPPMADPEAGAGEAPAAPEWSPVEPDVEPTDDVVPGTSIANAPVVLDGSYALDINAGETQVLAVPLGWGQDLQAQVDATLAGPVAEAAAVGSDLTVEVMGPVRNAGAVNFYGDAPPDWTVAALGNLRAGERFRTGAQTHTVAYAQRESSDARIRGAALPGLRYVRVALDVRGDDANLPYVLTLRTNGEPAEAPAYADDGGLVAPEAPSRLTVAPSSDDTATVREDTESSSESEEGNPGWVVPAAGGVALAVLGFALVAGLVVRARRRR